MKRWGLHRLICGGKAVLKELRWQIDSCPGTKVFCFWGVALLVLLGMLDVVGIFFMIPGHTKFTPDNVARQIAGVFKRFDTFDQGMLLKCNLCHGDWT